MFANQALVLVEECVEPEQHRPRGAARAAARAEEVLARIDEEALRKRVREARTTAERDEARDLTAEYDRALADRKRAEVFLRIAGESE